MVGFTVSRFHDVMLKSLADKKQRQAKIIS